MEFFRGFFAKPSSSSLDSKQNKGWGCSRRHCPSGPPVLRGTGGSGKSGKMERRLRGAQGRAHLGGEKTAGEPAADSHGRPVVALGAVAFRRASRDEDSRRACGSSRTSSRRPRVAPAGPQGDESTMTRRRRPWHRLGLVAAQGRGERTLMPPRGGVNRRDDQIKPFFLKNLSLTGQGG
jgi:hypothetical protein